MSKIEREPIMDCLFSRQGMTLVNIKFFRGTADVIDSSDLEEQAHSAIMQRRLNAGLKTANAPKSGLLPINVREFVATL